MAPLKRLTPDVGFPESQGGREAYGTAWPLSEDYYLCIYDATLAAGAPGTPGTYGIYLVDAFGNQELLYRDPSIACQSPRPLRARPRPPATPALAKPARHAPGTGLPAPEGTKPQATLTVVNAYDSLLAWPAGTKITALRVLQVLPMTVPSGGPPHETGARVALAGDSVVPVRHVLGTVPVEADGSAHFTVPANKELFFQALDDRGLAVQSMRSATYLQEGEHLVCHGCHDKKHRVPQPLTGRPLALERAPSSIRPDVDGSQPFSYPRLVQPVLDRQCVKCHAEKADKAPNLAREPLQRKWYASYHSLLPFSFTDYGSNLRTTPGKFGARASKLLAILDKGHYDVKLTDEEFHRIALWLDCSSMFYGVYEKAGGEAQFARTNRTTDAGIGPCAGRGLPLQPQFHACWFRPRRNDGVFGTGQFATDGGAAGLKGVFPRSQFAEREMPAVVRHGRLIGVLQRDAEAWQRPAVLEYDPAVDRTGARHGATGAGRASRGLPDDNRTRLQRFQAHLTRRPHEQVVRAGLEVLGRQRCAPGSFSRGLPQRLRLVGFLQFARLIQVQAEIHRYHTASGIRAPWPRPSIPVRAAPSWQA